MRCPSLKRLCETFRDLEVMRANQIRKLARNVDKPDALRWLIENECPETHAYVRSMYSDPYDSAMWRRTIMLHAIDRLLGTHGVEPLGPASSSAPYAPPFEYCNAGDTYSTTIIYSRASDALRIGCWGDIRRT